MLGTYVLSAGYYDAYYLKAQKVRTLIKNDFDAAFEKVDCIITPTTPCLPFRIGEKIADPLQMYLVDIYTASLNFVRSARDEHKLRIYKRLSCRDADYRSGI